MSYLIGGVVGIAIVEIIADFLFGIGFGIVKESVFALNTNSFMGMFIVNAVTLFFGYTFGIFLEGEAPTGKVYGIGIGLFSLLLSFAGNEGVPIFSNSIIQPIVGYFFGYSYARWIDVKLKSKQKA